SDWYHLKLLGTSLTPMIVQVRFMTSLAFSRLLGDSSVEYARYQGSQHEPWRDDSKRSGNGRHQKPFTEFSPTILCAELCPRVGDDGCGRHCKDERGRYEANAVALDPRQPSGEQRPADVDASIDRREHRHDDNCVQRSEKCARHKH